MCYILCNISYPVAISITVYLYIWLFGYMLQKACYSAYFFCVRIGQDLNMIIWI
jgi:hypothetical protein